MSSIFGEALKVSLFGESHGPYIGITADSLSAGIKIDEDYISHCLSLRRPQGKGETARVEEDHYQIISGVFNGYTTGMPLTILIPNENTRSTDYEKNKGLPRPSHADYVAHEKYAGFEDYRGGGHFSGRLTTPIVALGAILLKELENHGIKIGSHILELGGIKDQKFTDFETEIDQVNSLSFPVITDVADSMKAKIEEVAKNQDSIGGIIETAVTGLPVGLGEPFFSSLESNLSKAIFSIGAIKGIEFGDGFDFASLTGKTANDEFVLRDGKIVTKTNHNGGINGGISNGMPVTFNCVIKPTPSIALPQQTVNLMNKEETTLSILGRHDPAIIRRVNIVIRSMTAIVITDFLMLRYGNEVLRKGF